MQVVCDIECNSLNNPTQIWLIVCKNIVTGSYAIFKEVTTNEEERRRFRAYAKTVNTWIGHNFLGYDYPNLRRLIDLSIQDPHDHVVDTLVLSKLIDYPRGKHSIEDYGLEFGIPKGKFSDWTKYSKEMEEYCIRDVDICEKIYLKYLKYISKEEHKASIKLEHRFQSIVNDISNNGFSFNIVKAKELLTKVEKDLSILDKELLEAFPPKEVLIREFIPKLTKYGSISKTSIPRVLHEKIHEYEAGKSYKHTKLVEFNPSSHKQLIEVLTEAKWDPEEKTQTHIETERELNKLKYSHSPTKSFDLETLHAKLVLLEKSGWKISETNLATLPDTAPTPARLLAKRILLESRRRTLTEWLALVIDGRIHGKFYGIGAWTHRMAHQRPNTANIPNEFDTQGNRKLLGKELRSLWQAPRKRLLVGVDAEGIQLRIFAHYIDDKEFTDAIVNGRKSDKTDPHNLNQRVLGDVCKSRTAAKRFIFALLLGAGIGKLAQILVASEDETRRALDRLLERYQGFAKLKEQVIPTDAKRGWFIGIDGRLVKIPGETVGTRKHLCMSGYLQNGEAVVMKAATIKWYEEIDNDLEIDRLLFRKGTSITPTVHTGPIASRAIQLVDLVHDEWQTETPNNMELAIRVAEIQSGALRKVGEEFKLKCPLAGSYFNEDNNDYTIGTNWYATH